MSREDPINPPFERCYKVVQPAGGKLKSCVVWHSKSSVTYPVRAVTTSEYGPMLVFKHLEDAQKFMADCMGLNWQIWRALGANLKPEQRLAPMGWEWDIDDVITAFWDGELHPYTCSRAPDGTYSATAVMLLGRVE